MKKKEEYMVRLGGPDEEVEFMLGNLFFASIESEEYDGGDIHAGVEVIKNTGVVTLNFHLKGSLNIMCDRCLEFYQQGMDAKQTLFVKFGEESREVDENVIMISREENQIDVAQFLREILILSLPLKKVHPDNIDGSSACNEMMIEKLNEHLVKESEIETDHRWDELKKLKDKN